MGRNAKSGTVRRAPRAGVCSLPTQAVRRKGCAGIPTTCCEIGRYRRRLWAARHTGWNTVMAGSTAVPGWSACAGSVRRRARMTRAAAAPATARSVPSVQPPPTPTAVRAKLPNRCAWPAPTSSWRRRPRRRRWSVATPTTTSVVTGASIPMRAVLQGPTHLVPRMRNQQGDVRHGVFDLRYLCGSFLCRRQGTGLRCRRPMLLAPGRSHPLRGACRRMLERANPCRRQRRQLLPAGGLHPERLERLPPGSIESPLQRRAGQDLRQLSLLMAQPPPFGASSTSKVERRLP